MGRKVHTFHQLFQKLQICLLRGGQSFYKQSCSGRIVSDRRLRAPTSNPVLKNLKFGTPWASYGCFGDHLSAFEVKFLFCFFEGVETAAIAEQPDLNNLERRKQVQSVCLTLHTVSKIKNPVNFYPNGLFETLNIAKAP